ATRPTTRVRTLLHLAEAATRGTPPPPDADVTSRGSLRAAERAVRRQLRAEGVVRRGGRGLGPSSARLAVVQRQAHALLQRRVQELSPTSRHAQRGAIARARALIDAARHAGAQAALRRWLAEHAAAAAPEWLRGWERHPELAALLPSAPLAPAAPPAGAGAAGRSARRVRAGRRHGRLHALLLLLPEPSAALGGYASACSAPRGGSPSSSTLTAP
ncbi:MAG: hypothetical protein KJT01_16925, partial [Gemmatimonadetes bacterium]|nr:hypothetical protein [Gemmatimonadota bacterium]